MDNDTLVPVTITRGGCLYRCEYEILKCANGPTVQVLTVLEAEVTDGEEHEDWLVDHANDSSLNEYLLEEVRQSLCN